MIGTVLARGVLGLTLVLGSACNTAPIELTRHDTDTDTSSSSDGGSDDTDTSGGGPMARPAPQILGAPPVVARGGHLYVMIDAPLNAVIVDVGGRPLGDPSDLLHTDIPGALWIVPHDLPLGPTQLAVRLRERPAVAATRPLEIVQPRLEEVADATGLAQVHDVSGSPPECAQSHTGLAFGDIDGDGAPDAFVGNVGRGGRLHRNVGDRDGDGLPAFEDVTSAVGLDGVDSVAMATFVDLEGDGDLDLFVGRRGTNRLFENELVPSGVLAFDDITAAVGLGVESQRTMGVAFGDYDGDDDLDLYVVNHAFCFPTQGSDIRAEDHLYRNDGGHFVERTQDLAGDVLSSVGFSAVWVDVDRDGDQDLVVVNDAIGGMIGLPNALWRNDGPAPDGEGWSFTDVSEASGVALPGANGMGLALGDIDDDGFVDLAFTDIGPNHLLVNRGDGTFDDIGSAAGVERSRLPWDRESITWAAHLFDHDDDGDLDLYFSGGRIQGGGAMPDAFFDNLGDGLFEDVTWASGLSDPDHGKASALVDLDRDGAWELATASWGDSLRVYRNRAEQPDRRWLDVELQGRGANRDALGAIVELDAGGRTLTCFHTQRPSLGGGGETACHFGLGGIERVDALRIVWPDGAVDEREPPAMNQRIRFIRAAG